MFALYEFSFILNFLNFFFVALELNTGVHTCKAGALPLESHLHPCLKF
jgi:hypothetical protein